VAVVVGTALYEGGADVEGSTVEGGGAELGAVVGLEVVVGSWPWLLAVAIGFVPSGQLLGGKT
jgi:hypothetical protein